MKKIALIAAAASLVMSLASVSASADPVARDTMMTRVDSSSSGGTSSVPEPTTLALLALGLGGLGIARRRRH